MGVSQQDHDVGAGCVWGLMGGCAIFLLLIAYFEGPEAVPQATAENEVSIQSKSYPDTLQLGAPSDSVWLEIHEGGVGRYLATSFPREILYDGGSKFIVTGPHISIYFRKGELDEWGEGSPDASYVNVFPRWERNADGEAVHYRAGGHLEFYYSRDAAGEVFPLGPTYWNGRHASRIRLLFSNFPRPDYLVELALGGVHGDQRIDSLSADGETTYRSSWRFLLGFLQKNRSAKLRIDDESKVYEVDLTGFDAASDLGLKLLF